MSRRVVVTGMSGVTAFGNDWAAVEPKLRACENATQYMPSYEQYDGLNTKLAAPIDQFELPKHYKRKQVRGMGVFLSSLLLLLKMHYCNQDLLATTF